eukprot:883455_1
MKLRNAVTHICESIDIRAHVRGSVCALRGKDLAAMERAERAIEVLVDDFQEFTLDVPASYRPLIIFRLGELCNLTGVKTISDGKTIPDTDVLPDTKNIADTKTIPDVTAHSDDLISCSQLKVCGLSHEVESARAMSDGWYRQWKVQVLDLPLEVTSHKRLLAEVSGHTGVIIIPDPSQSDSANTVNHAAPSRLRTINGHSDHSPATRPAAHDSAVNHASGGNDSGFVQVYVYSQHDEAMEQALFSLRNALKNRTSEKRSSLGRVMKDPT